MNARFHETRLALLQRIPEIVKFVKDHGKGIFNYPDAQLIDIFMQHINFGTLIVMDDDKGITVVERWNYIDENIFYSLDTVIRPDCRNVSQIKALMKYGVENSIYSKTLRYVLYRKGQHMELGYRIHDIEKFLGNGECKINREGTNDQNVRV